MYVLVSLKKKFTRTFLSIYQRNVEVESNLITSKVTLTIES